MDTGEKKIQKKITVLVVDDLLFMRNAIAAMLKSDPDIHVIGTAADGMEAVEKTLELKPDIITLDINMPRMNGLEALRIIMDKRPTPTLIISSLTEKEAYETVEALSLGAVDFIPKNLNGLSINIAQIKSTLIEKIKQIALHNSGDQSVSQKRGTAPVCLPVKRKGITPCVDIVAIGSSTGGPRARQDVLSPLPSDFPVYGIVVQHMPPLFIDPLARRLDQQCEITVKMAHEGDILEKGVFLIAPGGYHLHLKRGENREVRVVLETEPGNSLHRPSVNEMMLSVARLFPGSALGVILTGMGKDGLEGMRAIKENNGRTIAQDETSCVVYGMPRPVVEENLADKVVPLSRIGREIIAMIEQ